MKKFYGIWLDHSGAYVVEADPNDVKSVKHVDSSVDPHHKSADADEHLTMADHNSDDRRRHEQMHKFAQHLMDIVKDGDEIVVCGPSTAKFEFKKEYEKNKAFAEKVVAFETCDKMTENQLKSFVKELLKVPRNEVIV